jgi:DNA-binding LytR/AlgR family response regulator
MSLRCVIVDDEYLAIRVLQEYARQVPDLTIVQTFTDPQQALAYLFEHSVDLLFLDIQMPYLTGFDLLNKLREVPMVIFTTARHDYAVQAFELDVIDYLVKPIAFGRFEKAVQRARAYQEYQQHKVAGHRTRHDHIMIRADHRIFQLSTDNIIYIEGLSEYIKIYTTDKMYITHAALKDILEELPPQRFARIHKSFIVSRSYIVSFNHQQVHLTNRKELPIGRTYKPDFLIWINASLATDPSAD